MKAIISFYKNYVWAFIQVLCMAACVWLSYPMQNDSNEFMLIYFGYACLVGPILLFLGCLWNRLPIVIATAALSFVVVLFAFSCKAILWLPAGMEPDWNNFTSLAGYGTISFGMVLNYGLFSLGLKAARNSKRYR